MQPKFDKILGQLREDDSVSGAVSSVNSQTGDVILTSDNIIEGSTNLYISSVQETILNNTSGTNTGDETQSSIITKIGYTPLAPNGSGASLTNLNLKNLIATNSTHLVCNSSSTQSLTAGVYAKLVFPAKWNDSLNEWDTSNSRFTPSFSQTILFVPNIFLSVASSATALNIKKNGTDYITYGLPSGQAILTSFPIYFQSGYYYEFYISSNVSNTINPYSSMYFYTFFGGT